MKRKSVNFISIFLFVVSFSMLLIGSSADSSYAEKVVKLRVQSWGGATYLPRIMVEDIIGRLEKSGHFKITYYAGEPLVTAKEAFDAVREGLLDIAISAAAYHEDRMGPVGVIQWTARNFNFDKFSAHYRDPGGFMDFVQPYYQKVNLRLLSDMHTPPGQIFTSKPVNRIEDMEGLLVRDPGAMKDWLKLLGAAPVSIASPEVWDGFQRGIIEGTVASMGSYMSNKWFEVAPHISKLDWFLGGMQLIMNEELYQSIPPEAKTALNEAVLAAEDAYWKGATAEQAAFFKAAREAGVTIHEFTPEEVAQWEERIQPFFGTQREKYGEAWDKLMAIRQTLR